MYKSYTIRLYPTKEQELKLWQHVHASRFVWNWGLAYQLEQFKENGKIISEYELKKMLPCLKSKNEWLREVSNASLARIILDLGKAYKKFFSIQKLGEKFTANAKKRAKTQKRALTVYDMKGYPKFKKRKEAKPNFYVRYEHFYFKNDTVNIEKVGKVAIKSSYKNIPEKAKFTNPTAKFENNKWILSFGLECEKQALKLTEQVIGIDLGVKSLAVTSTGEVFKNINKSYSIRKLAKKLKYFQRKLARQEKESICFEKTKSKIKNIYQKLANIRKNHTHNTTRKIVNYLPKAIVMEDLNVQGMMKNKHLSKAIAEQCFYEFRRQITYKAEWMGIDVIFADRFFPSSKTCSGCGKIKKDLKLSDRKFNCTCGLSLDRDLNAAINLSKLAN